MDMELLSVLIRQVFIMFVLMAVGYYAYKKELITDQGSKDIGKILLNVAVPMIVISNFCIERSPEKTAELLQSAFLSILCMLLSVLVSVLIYHKSDRIGEFSVAFSNAGFIGIPLVQATFGSSAVFYITAMIVLVPLLQWTYGVYTITDDKSFMDPKKVLKNPIVIAVILGLIIYFTGFQMPKIASDIISMISSMNTPLAMIVSGVYLAQSDLLAMIRKKNAYLVSLVRLILIPLLMVIVFRFLPFENRTMKLAILLAGACPVGSNVAIFARQYDKDHVSAVEYVCLSTLLCIITLPLMIFLADIIL